MATPDMPRSVRAVAIISGSAFAIAVMAVIGFFVDPLSRIFNPHASPWGLTTAFALLACAFVALLVAVPIAAWALWRDQWVRTQGRINIVVTGGVVLALLAALLAATLGPLV